MIFDRRVMVGKLFMFPFAAWLVRLGLISCQSVISALKAWVPEGITAIDAIVTLVNPVAGSILSQIASALPGLWAAVNSAIAEYQSTTPPPADAEQKVVTALTDLSDNLAAFLSALPVSIPSITVGLIQLGLKLTIATINWFAGQHTTTTTAKISARSAAAAQGVTCAKNRDDYVKKFNAIGIKRANGTLVTLS